MSDIGVGRGGGKGRRNDTLIYIILMRILVVGNVYK